MFGLNITGMKDMLNSLKLNKNAFGDGLGEGGRRMKARAESLCPVLTGYLKSTIYVNVSGHIMTFGASADYALFVEYGTIYMGAQPFLRPAINENTDWTVNYIMDNLLPEL